MYLPVCTHVCIVESGEQTQVSFLRNDVHFGFISSYIYLHVCMCVCVMHVP